jgi:hypothetical protein
MKGKEPDRNHFLSEMTEAEYNGWWGRVGLT